MSSERRHTGALSPFLLFWETARSALRRFLAALPRYLAPEEGWLTVALLCWVLLAATGSVQSAHWVKQMPVLPWTALAAVFLGLLSAKLGGVRWLWQPLGLVGGAALVWWQTLGALPPSGVRERTIELGDRLRAWGEAVREGGTSTDTIPFILSVTAVAWLIAYFAAWALFRRHNVWLALVPSGVAMLSNLSYLPSHYSAYCFLYLLGAMLLVARVTMLDHRRSWRREGAKYPGTLAIPFLGNTFVVALGMLSLVWLLPAAHKAESFAGAWDTVASTWESASDKLDHLFQSVEGRNGTRARSFDGIAFSGRIRHTNEEVFSVRADGPYYWRAMAYETYTHGGWLASSVEAYPVGATAGEPDSARSPVSAQITTAVPSDIVFTAGDPVSVNVPAQVRVPAFAVYTVPLFASWRESKAPPEVVAVAERVRDLLGDASGSGGVASGEELDWALTEVGLETEHRYDLAWSGTLYGPELHVRQAVALPRDAVGVSTTTRLGAGQVYTVVSAVSTATESQLRAAGTDYPQSVLEHYLQLPGDMPNRVRDLARSLTSTEDTPYDKALALESYLRGLTYSLDILPPPYGRDGVDYFLFDTKAGYCDYFASAMVVMLRMAGVPARLASGYAVGEYDAARHAHVLRDANSHSWPEVFFPGYGWIEFEPTPSQPPVNRSERSDGGAGLPDTALEFPEVNRVGGDEEQAEPAVVAATRDERRFTWVLWGLLPGVPAVLATAAVVSWRYSLRGLSGPSRAYELMSRFGALRGVAPVATETPAEYGRRLVRRFPQASALIDAVIRAYTRARFARGGASRDEEQRAWSAWERLRWMLLLKGWRKRRLDANEDSGERS